MTDHENVIVRNTQTKDFDGISELTRAVYPWSRPWTPEQLASHLHVFPDGQFVAVDGQDRVLGMASSLIVHWDDYDPTDDWLDFTEAGMFTSHDPDSGRTLYGAEVMVHPAARGQGVGKKLYLARRELVERLGLLRIRAGARLVGYHRYADELTATEYTIKVVAGEIGDSTLSFQLKNGFHVIAVVRGYLAKDPESLGAAAIIEWLNPIVATKEDFARLDLRFIPPGAPVLL